MGLCTYLLNLCNYMISIAKSATEIRILAKYSPTINCRALGHVLHVLSLQLQAELCQSEAFVIAFAKNCVHVK